ncbi:MAG TPA: HNH endonuclease signature motif containing protein [Tepidisphaeraceae bacterium]|nr:HNH endonuclease signature motif containing protein [Tepidisphaeraceae bacterium]
MHANNAWATCELCQRDVPRSMITLHHLTPRERGGTADDRSPLCKPCHKQLHAMFGNRQLERDYSTIEALRKAEALQPFLKWIRKQKSGRNFRTITSLAHPGSKRNRRGRRG